jgi:hypothetical protein
MEIVIKLSDTDIGLAVAALQHAGKLTGDVRCTEAAERLNDTANWLEVIDVR